ncbi:MAG: ABC transporter ATP-binding protein [Gammaproteobacteria bacterium]
MQQQETECDTPWDDPGKKPFIQIEGISKHFGEFVAVDSVSLDIYQGELFSILGSSGCGKTTLLRILAGLEVPTNGHISIDGVDMTNVPAYERPVNMMFQSYALFPHMTVEQNVAYGLKKEKVPAPELKDRVRQILELVQLSSFTARKPDQLSGGQQQRVALARALVKRPKVLLLDEPLAALDKKLREHTQFELVNIQDRLGVTFVVVTHDQEEAMTLSTRIAVMNEGRFVQVGTPGEIYEHPETRFTADFIGKINMFDGVVNTIVGNAVEIHCKELNDPISVPCDLSLTVDASVAVAVRPEKIFISKEPPESADRISIKGIVLDLGYFGNLSLYRVRLSSGKIIEVSAQNRRREARRTVEWDDEVFLSWDQSSTILLNE